MRGIQKQKWFMAAAIAMVMIVTPASKAQAINSGPTTVLLNATLAESLTLSVAPTTVTFTLVPSGTVAGSAPVVVTTTFVLGPTRTSLVTYAYFTSTTALIDGSGDIIPTANFLGQINGAGGFFGIHRRRWPVRRQQ